MLLFRSVLNTAMLSRFGSADSSIRVPHLLDIILLLHRLFRTESSDTPVHSFLSGTESEGDEFLTVLPKVFFINCVVGSGFRKLGKANYVHAAFPVILKRGQYYIIMGEANTPVYRVLNPKDLFFTPRGKYCLLYLLSQNLGEGENLNFYERGDGSVEAYCVPHFVDHVSDRWDFCAEGDVEELLHCPLVQQPIVPPSSRASVQIVNLGDSENIIDVTYPDDQRRN